MTTDDLLTTGAIAARPNECDVCGDLWRDCTCPNDTEDDE